MKRVCLLALLGLAACTSRGPAADARPVDVWVADFAEKYDRENVAAALPAGATMRRGELPPRRFVRRVELGLSECDTWDSLMYHAVDWVRALDGDAAIVREAWFTYPACSTIDIVRYANGATP